MSSGHLFHPLSEPPARGAKRSLSFPLSEALALAVGGNVSSLLLKTLFM